MDASYILEDTSGQPLWAWSAKSLDNEATRFRTRRFIEAQWLWAVQRDCGPLRRSIKKRSGRSVRIVAKNRARRSRTWRRVGPLSTREGWGHSAMGGVRLSSH